MRIIITQEEIEEAIEKLILDQVDVPDDMRIDIDLKATRGDQGYTAEIDIVAVDAPTDGSDRSVDERITPVDGAENLGIAEKVLEAKEAAVRPRRRGRPAGAKNKPRTHRVDPDMPETEKTQVTEEQPAQKPQEEVEQPEVVDTTDLVGDAPDEAPVTAEQDVQSDELDAEPNSEAALAAEAEATEPTENENESDTETDYAPTPETAGLETEVADGNDPEPVTSNPDVSTQVHTEALAETVEESIQAKAPDPEVVTETEVATPAPAANPAPTRSLFANLQRPVNKPIDG